MGQSVTLNDEGKKRFSGGIIVVIRTIGAYVCTYEICEYYLLAIFGRERDKHVYKRSIKLLVNFSVLPVRVKVFEKMRKTQTRENCERNAVGIVRSLGKKGHRIGQSGRLRHAAEPPLTSEQIRPGAFPRSFAGHDRSQEMTWFSGLCSSSCQCGRLWSHRGTRI